MLVAAVAAAGLAVLLFVMGPPRRPSAPAPAAEALLWHVPDFALVSERGAPYGSADLRGRVWVVDFFFTTCRGICPALTTCLRDVGRRAPGVKLVSVSVDPEHDTPAVLAAYADSVGADSSWAFLTGPPADVRRLVQEGFRLAADPAPPGAAEPILHSPKVALVDATGMIRGFYDALDSTSVARLVADARGLLSPAS
jgi:protein SCO1/2